MFTGIIEEVGTVENIVREADSILLTINAEKVLEDTILGDSIAVNGVCLTVTELTSQTFTVDIMHETMNMTSLRKLINGSEVNLERALTMSKRLGGHIVAGHVDGVGTITEIKHDGIATDYIISTDIELLKYIVYKGSIAIDGISLTVADVTETAFKICIIPHTKEVTTLSQKKVGDVVNIETDAINRYIYKLLMQNTKETKKQNTSRVNKGLLEQYGFL